MKFESEVKVPAPGVAGMSFVQRVVLPVSSCWLGSLAM